MVIVNTPEKNPLSLCKLNYSGTLTHKKHTGIFITYIHELGWALLVIVCINNSKPQTFTVTSSRSKYTVFP